MDFKVGDRVKINASQLWAHNSIGTITSTMSRTNNPYQVTLDKPVGYHGNYFPAKAYELELLPPQTYKVIVEFDNAEAAFDFMVAHGGTASLA